MAVPSNVTESPEPRKELSYASQSVTRISTFAPTSTRVSSATVVWTTI